jgi:hypothetical protein
MQGPIGARKPFSGGKMLLVAGNQGGGGPASQGVKSCHKNWRGELARLRKSYSSSWHIARVSSNRMPVF